MTKLYIPSVHLNGTSKKELLEQWRAVHDAAEVLVRVLQAASPHGRDYYIQQGDPTQDAIQANRERIGAIYKIMDEATAIYQKIDEQGR
jgi:hypothetical protein